MTAAQLHDIVSPEPVSWIPQTAGWAVLFGVLVVAGAWVGWRRWRRWRADRYRREALSRLAELTQAAGDERRRAGALAGLPVLVKQTALAGHRRSEVAGLNGDEWLRFLDESYGGDGFVAGPGRWLPTFAYAPPAALEAVPEQDVRGAFDVVGLWIKKHRSGKLGNSEQPEGEQA